MRQSKENVECNQNKERNIFCKGKHQKKKYRKEYKDRKEYKETDTRNGGTEISVVKRKCEEYVP
jgi:hypothetical protein